MSDFGIAAGSILTGTTDVQIWEERIASAFANLSAREILALGQAGQTQYDALPRVEQHFRAAPAAGAGLGACFYTQEDDQRARATGELRLALWAPEDHFDDSMRAIGHAVVEEFSKAGLEVFWDGRSRSRPVVRLV